MQSHGRRPSLVSDDDSCDFTAKRELIERLADMLARLAVLESKLSRLELVLYGVLATLGSGLLAALVAALIRSGPHAG